MGLHRQRRISLAAVGFVGLTVAVLFLGQPTGVGAAGVGTTKEATKTVGATGVGAASTSFTAYVGSGSPASLGSVSKTMGYKITTALDGFARKSWSGIDDDMWVIERWKGTGYHMIWYVPMLPDGGGVSLATGAAGAYNDHFVLLAQHLVSAGMGDSVLRLGWEFNQSKYPWYAAGQPTNFVAYWRQIVTAMRSVPGANFTFEWNPSRGDNGPKNQGMGNLADYYPGNDYVGIIGMDVYDSAWDYYPGATGEFHKILTQRWGLNWLASFGADHDKPIAIPELGLGSGPSTRGSRPLVANGQVSGGDDPTFISDMLNWVAHNNVVNLAFWDFQSSSIQNGRDPLAAKALRTALHRDLDK